MKKSIHPAKQASKPDHKIVSALQKLFPSLPSTDAAACAQAFSGKKEKSITSTSAKRVVLRHATAVVKTFHLPVLSNAPQVLVSEWSTKNNHKRVTQSVSALRRLGKAFQKAQEIIGSQR